MSDRDGKSVAGRAWRRIWGFAWTGGILFAAFDRCGYMLKQYGSIWALSENPLHRTIVHRIILRLPFSVAAVLALLLLTDALCGKSAAVAETASGGRDVRLRPGSVADRLQDGRYRFAAAWLLFFVSFLPALLGGYPGIFAADAPNQIGWTFSGWLTAHHPLLHTGFLCGIFTVTRTLGLSDNTAAAVCSVLQMLALSGIFAWLLRFLERENAPVWLRAGTALYLCLFPFHAMMSVYTTKDTLFSGVFLLCVLQLFRMVEKPEEYFSGRRQACVGGGCFLLLFLLRNNGFHTLLLCMPFLFPALRRYWKKLLLLAAALLLLYQFYNGPCLRLLGAQPGDAREAYSVLMQTLGRTYTAGGDIRPEEMDVIRPVMSEETLSQYTPALSDPIKNFFYTEAFADNRAEFLKTWAAVGWRNKKIYVDALLSTTAAFWYPGTAEEYLEFVCFDIEKDNPYYPHVRMTPVVDGLFRYYTAVGTDASFRKIPVLRELLSMGFYFWLLVYAGLYALYRRQYRKLLWMLPFWTYMGTSFLGPAALLRYAYPLMLGAPLLVFFLVADEGRTEAGL